jgi:hypothetical protein
MMGGDGGAYPRWASEPGKNVIITKFCINQPLSLFQRWYIEHSDSSQLASISYNRGICIEINIFNDLKLVTKNLFESIVLSVCAALQSVAGNEENHQIFFYF